MIEAEMVESADSPTQIWYQFNLFASNLYDTRKMAGFSDDDLNDMPTPEYIKAIEHWMNEHSEK
jgi:hypothetical protein